MKNAISMCLKLLQRNKNKHSNIKIVFTKITMN